MKRKSKNMVREENFTGKINENESTGRGPDLQDMVKPLTRRSKRPSAGVPSCSPSRIDGNKFHKILDSSVAVSRKAVAISRDQLHRGSIVHLESFTNVSKAASPTIGDRRKGLTNLT